MAKLQVPRGLSRCALLVVVGCATPVMHPMRVSEGFSAEGALMFGAPNGRYGSCGTTQGCVDGASFGGYAQPAASGSYGGLITKNVGLMAGLTFPALENQKRSKWYTLVSAYAIATLQNDYVAFGVGPEVGAGGIAVVAGGDVRPWGSTYVAPSLGVYARRFWPYSPQPAELDGRVATWDVGVRVRVGPGYLQYAFYRQDEGVMHYPFWPFIERGPYAEGFHIFSLGLIMDRELADRIKK